MGKKIRNIIINILIVICLLTAIGSGVYIFIYYHKSAESEEKFDTLKEDIQEDYLDGDGRIEYVEVKDNDDEKIRKIFKKYANLYCSNNDFIGWLMIEGTNIDYPVMYTPDDAEFYLHRDFYKEYSSAGTLFVDTGCTPVGDVSDNILIYGHNMKSGTMFHDLLKYEDEEFYKEHKYITFDTLEGMGTYEVIGAMRTKAYPDDDTEHYHYYDFLGASNQEEFDTYVDFIRENTPYTPVSTAEYGDNLITLSTCAYHTNEGRYVVVAKKVDKSSIESETSK